MIKNNMFMRIGSKITIKGGIEVVGKLCGCNLDCPPKTGGVEANLTTRVGTQGG